MDDEYQDNSSKRPSENDPTEPAESFPIVGLGASAGGLEAFTRFFNALPESPGMAFVLIQHLDPNHESLMPDLLGRHTALKVMQVKERTRVKKNTVYIIPPGKYLGLQDQHLVLSQQPPNRGMRMTIDHFFQTLAETRREKAICIILSGTASDGTMGMKAVKANGGLAIVQDPETAQYDGMPRSAISTGAVDRVLAPEAMPAVLMEYAKHPYVNGGSREESETAEDEVDVMDTVLTALHAKTGQEFKGYKKSTLGRRIQRRMSLNHIVRGDEYLELIRGSHEEAEALFKDLLINVTSFFRDAEAWDTLAGSVLPKLADRCDRDHAIRVWAPGCATGEEVYSIAMLLQETLERREKRCDVQIFGTDIDKDAFHIARNGRYPASIAADITNERLDNFFDKDQDFYVVKKKLRESVVFAPQSLINDPPFSNLDLIVCRNLLIYLEQEIQYKIIRLFHFALKEDGFLFLGNSETIGTQKDLFEPVSKTWRIYKRLGSGRTMNIELPVFRMNRGRRDDEPQGFRRGRRMSISSIAQHAVLKHYAPPAAVVDRNLDVVYYQGDTGAFLRLPEGEPTRSIMDQAAPGIRTRLRWLINSVTESGMPQTTEEISLRSENGRFDRLTIEAKPLKQPAEAEGLVLIAFLLKPTETDSEADSADQKRAQADTEDRAVDQLEYELKVTREELQSTIEELETSNEELKASNEEAMSMNEELQSTNEELETNKEELQSLNEELTTVNNELREKVRELEEANNDMSNLLANTHIPTIFLHRDLRIKRFTPAAQELMRLVSSDMGRRFDHIARRFEDPELVSDIRAVLKDLSPREKEIRSDKDRWYVRRILPYRTQDDRIIGSVITFLDITQRRKHLEEIQAREDQLHRAITQAPLPVILFAEDQEILMVSETWTEITGYTIEEIPRLSDWTTRAYGHDAGSVQSHISRVIEGGERMDEGEFVIRTKDGKDRIWHFYSSPLGTLPDGRRMVVGMAIDVTSRRQAEKALKEKEEQLRKTNASLEEKIEERTFSLKEKTDQLQKLATELSQVEQRERRRLASTLHDHLQQIIASARMRLEGVDALGGANAQDELLLIRDMLQEAASACRDVTVQLAPPVLYDSGFSAAASWLCGWFAEQHNLEVACDVDTVAVHQDTGVLLFQSIKELLFNVVKHAGTSKATLSVKDGQKGTVSVSVTDAGRGFDPDTLKSLGEKNDGFGLFSIRERIQMAGGELEIESAPDKGVAVRITISSGAEACEASPSPGSGSPSDEKRTPETTAGKTAGIRVLIADDHQLFREGLNMVLEKEKDITVVGEACDGRDALEKARMLLPDVVLMDLNMPVMNGLEATRHICKENPDVRVIILSVNSKKDIADAMMDAGAVAYQPKGGPSRELVAEIRKQAGQ